MWECKTRLKRVLLGREHPVKVLALAAMITVNNRINSVKLKHMVVWLFAVNLGLGSAFAGAGSVYDVDGDGEVKALTDGLLVIRHQFGFTGASVVNGALGEGAVRTAGADVAQYVAANYQAFDLDGDGEHAALTDGLMLIRYMFGFTGDAMVDGAVSLQAPRANYVEIKGHLDNSIAASVGSGGATDGGGSGSGGTTGDGGSTGGTTNGSGSSAGEEPPLRFVYQSKCTVNTQNQEVCFTEEEAGFQTVTVQGAGSGASVPGFQKTAADFGVIKVQSIAAQWPDGEVFEDAQGQKSFSINRYDGYQQNRVADAVAYESLSAIGQSGRWGAKAVVQVYADRCLLNQNGTKDWRFASLPRSGFFIAEDLVLTDKRSSVNFEMDPSGGGTWIGGVSPLPENPSEPMTCQALVDFFFQGAENISIEVGAGPFIQTFDGVWGAGKVVAEDDNFALIQVTKGSLDKDTLVSSWRSWEAIDKQTAVLQLAPEDARDGTLVAIHHPVDGRDAGGWHLTTGAIIKNCEETFYLDGYRGGVSDVFAIDFWSDGGSAGAPILNEQGLVVGMVKTDYPAVPDECYDMAYTGKNSLGVLSTFFADPKKSTVALGSEALKTFVSNYDADQNAIKEPASKVNDDTVWPVSGVTLATTNYEVIDYGDSFTESGFPKSEMSSPAFDVAKQATVMFLKENGCTNCASGLITEDFSDTCLCTGFAVSKNLIVTNDHCTTSLFPNDETTFQTFQGQVVNARLVNRSGLDTGTIYRALLSNPQNADQEGAHNGDVALLRTDQDMDLVPITFSDSTKLVRREPLITVGHPAIMLRSGPYVTSGGAFIGLNMDERSTLHYTLPASGGASGSGVFDLNGGLVGQIAYGGTGYRAAEETWIKSELNKQALEVSPSDVFFDLQPRPFLIGPKVQIGLGRSTSGASSEYIKALVEYWAPDELPQD